ncbi:hypothetical protein ACOZ4L_14685 [Haloplanus ruber]|uniref:Transcription factor zinc-finger domain-containing protein n=1 Tax=Haloplanus ruber TaxID=869892 RepID=A0ABD6CYV4_9EURY|nr:hypothetical protein [Haloplanus ruber]
MSLSSRSTDPSELAACPSCENEVLNVQGIHACSSCSWVVPEYQ